MGWLMGWGKYPMGWLMGLADGVRTDGVRTIPHGLADGVGKIPHGLADEDNTPWVG